MKMPITPFIVSIFLFLPVLTSAATAVVSVDTGNERINAVEGSLVFPDKARVDTVSPGDSVISMWIVPPAQTGQTVDFSGITPGGFSGVYTMFTITGDFTAEDIAQAQFTSVAALASDGAGTRVPVSMHISLMSARLDTEPPESFTPIIARDPDIYDGKYFLVFATQDKSSGVARYEVREGRWGRFHQAKSPYLLKHQHLDADVYVKAIDNAGNERVALVKSEYKPRWEHFGFIAILIVLVLGVLALKRKWSRFAQ